MKSLILLFLVIGMVSALFSYADSQIECKENYILVKRLANNKFACVTQETSKIWEERGISTPIKQDIQDNQTKKILAHESFEMISQVPNIASKYPTITLTQSMLAGQEVIIFEGMGFRESHVIDIRIIDEQGNRIKLKPKTTQDGYLLMPWPIPDNLKPGEYDIQIWDRVSEHYLRISLE